jgi:hypothetical protein
MTDSFQLGFSGMVPLEDPSVHARSVLMGRSGPWKPTDLQIELLRILLLHQGAHWAIPLRDLMGKLQRVCDPIPSEREIKDAARSLVVDFKVRIGASRSKPVGYFLIISAKEARETARPYISEIRELARRVRVLLDPHDLAEFAGQRWLEELFDESAPEADAKPSVSSAGPPTEAA